MRPLDGTSRRKSTVAACLVGFELQVNSGQSDQCCAIPSLPCSLVAAFIVRETLLSRGLRCHHQLQVPEGHCRSLRRDHIIPHRHTECQGNLSLLLDRSPRSTGSGQRSTY
ncbi:hypothetical protein BDN72DRAFT_93686 [Pluteus cervinus]|uniref:Uncharacterized protein n=1 Tax=Pluteus cervinus TaxID=181527 RepID=A0ACD3ANP7_9AGAR|nr:hypothetical protein BDN72DRAFT_93686 [Pluteus cervinus]